MLDVSGSMHGFPLDTAKTLMRDCIGGLRPTDMFNIVVFAGGTRRCSPRRSGRPRANVEAALQFIGREARRRRHRAAARPQAGAGDSAPATACRARVVRDRRLHRRREAACSISSASICDETNLFAFGIGSSVNRHLIEGMARAGQGEPFVVHRRARLPSAATFRRYIESPVLTGINVTFTGFDAYEWSRRSFPTCSRAGRWCCSANSAASPAGASRSRGRRDGRRTAR